MFVQSMGLIIAALMAAQMETTFSVEYAGKKYDFRITDQDLKSTPSWSSTQENPPVSARRAIDIASRQLATLVPNGKDWRVSQISLRPIEGYWIYIVEFLEPVQAGLSSQQSRGFQTIVLMNGVAVTPRISTQN